MTGMAGDPVLERIAAAYAIFTAGRRAEAREAFAAIWTDIAEDGDPYHQCVLSHYMADAQDQLADELAWDRRALDAADRIVRERPDAASLTLLSFYPSLHFNLADVMFRSGDRDGARRHLALAQQATGALADDGYGRMVRGAIDRLATRLAE